MVVFMNVPRKKSQKPVKLNPPVDPVREKDLERLAEINRLMSTFWSSRSGYLPPSR
jgi:hypothetical protein